MKPQLVEIIDYRDEFQQSFKDLNMQWLQQYSLLEPRDLEALDYPRETIISNGGAIFLAALEEQIIGTGAVIFEHGHYELAKMTVAPEFRGMGVSKLLMNKCLGFVRSAGAKKVILYSNSQLQSALHLYKAYGFKHVIVEDTPFQTADVKMELVFNP